MSKKITKGCHTCLWNDEPQLKICQRLQKELIFLRCPNWQEKIITTDELNKQVDKIIKTM